MCIVSTGATSPIGVAGINNKKMGPVERKMSLSSDVRLRVVYGHINPQSLNEPLCVKYVHAQTLLMRRRQRDRILLWTGGTPARGRPHHPFGRGSRKNLACSQFGQHFRFSRLNILSLLPTAPPAPPASPSLAFPSSALYASSAAPAFSDVPRPLRASDTHAELLPSWQLGLLCTAPEMSSTARMMSRFLR